MKTGPVKKAEIARLLSEGKRVMEIVAATGTDAHQVGKVRKELLAAGYHAAGKVKKPPSIEDELAGRRQQNEITALRKDRTKLLDELNTARDLRGNVLGLASEPLDIRPIPKMKHGKKMAETAVLCISDVHMGEVVNLEQMDGVNSYDQHIATARLQRLFAKTGELLTDHYKGPPLERLVVWVGGDMITGEIHEELAKTNDMNNFPAVKRVAEITVAGIKHLRDVMPSTQIEVISTPGNHGRTARKPEAKLYAIDSLDTLTADFIELGLKTAGIDVPVYRPRSGDMLIDVGGRNVLFTHGDRIGSRGGQGFVGAAATVARGFKKITGEYASRGTILDWIVIGHFHVDLKLEEGFVNPSVIGPTEYGRDARFKPHPAGQRLFLMHPRHGITLDRVINLGEPEEGSIYKEKA